MRPVFRGRVQGLEERDGKEGIAEVLVAVFDKVDTRVASGNKERQVIDKGAFRSFVENMTSATNPVRPMFLDHGDAMMTGFATASKKLGYADNFRETDEGLAYTGHYNLGTQRGREAWSDLEFDPNGTQFSFRWPPNEDTYRDDDGVEHVRTFFDVMEVSQVGFGAQAETGVLATTMRTASEEVALRPHSTETVDASWDAKKMTSLLPDTSLGLRSMYAWAITGEERDELRYPHHMVDETDHTVGPANLVAVRSSLDALMRSSDSAEDIEGAYAHLAQHIEDAGQEPPKLRSPMTDLHSHLMVAHGLDVASGMTIEEVQARHAKAHADGEYADGASHDTSDLSMRSEGMRHAYHGDKVPPQPKMAVVKEWMKDDKFKEGVAHALGVVETKEEPVEDEEKEPELVEARSELEPAGFLPVYVSPTVSWTAAASAGTGLNTTGTATWPTGTTGMTYPVVLPYSGSGTPQIRIGTSELVKARAASVFELIGDIQDAWCEAQPQIPSGGMDSMPMAMSSCVVDIWVDSVSNSDFPSGFVIVQNYSGDEEFMKYSWKMVADDDGDMEPEFDMENGEEVEQGWVDNSGNLLRSAETPVLVRAIQNGGPEVLARVKAAIEEIEAPDPVAAFYRQLKSRWVRAVPSAAGE